MRIFPDREYKSGTRWGVWLWTDVRTEYITRLHLIKTPWFAVCLHWLNTPDPDPHLHDHPVSFLSIILRGWYKELSPRVFGGGGYRVEEFTHRRFNWVRYSKRHRIIRVGPDTLTLCFMGPKRQEWGFYTARGKVMWKDYYALLARGVKL